MADFSAYFACRPLNLLLIFPILPECKYQEIAIEMAINTSCLQFPTLVAGSSQIASHKVFITLLDSATSAGN
jgi:hypothetical protein